MKRDVIFQVFGNHTKKKCSSSFLKQLHNSSSTFFENVVSNLLNLVAHSFLFERLSNGVPNEPATQLFCSHLEVFLLSAIIECA